MEFPTGWIIGFFAANSDKDFASLFAGYGRTSLIFVHRLQSRDERRFTVLIGVCIGNWVVL